MTTFVLRDIRCAVCGHRNTYRLLASTNTLGHPDLDSRPAPMARDALLQTMLQCPGCGYCSSDLSRATPQAASVVSSDHYQAIRSDENLPALARAWLCDSHLQEALGRFNVAGWSAVRAAWACDDKPSQDQADELRRHAVPLFRHCMQARVAFAGNRGTERTILADLLRRSGDFQGALAICKEASHRRLSDDAEQLIRFERILAEDQDRDRYTVDQVLKQPGHGEELTEEESHILYYVVNYFERLMTAKEQKVVRQLRAQGALTLRQSIVERILREHAGEVYANRCPKCGRLPRTPRAKQCFWCHYDWHER